MSASSGGNLEIEVRIEGDGAVAKVIIPRDLPKQTLDASQLAAVVRQRGVNIDAMVEARLQQIVQADAPLKGPVTIGTDEQDQPQFRQGDGPTQALTEVAKVRNRAA